MTAIELTRYHVIPGKEKEVDEWMKFLNDNHDATVATMAGERMHVEDIFRETIDGKDYLYWFSVQSPNGRAVEDSDSEIDKKHLEYWDDCIDMHYPPEDLTLQMSLLSPAIQKVVDEVEKSK